MKSRHQPFCQCIRSFPPPLQTLIHSRLSMQLQSGLPGSPSDRVLPRQFAWHHRIHASPTPMYVAQVCPTQCTTTTRSRMTVWASHDSGQSSSQRTNVLCTHLGAFASFRRHRRLFSPSPLSLQPSFVQFVALNILVGVVTSSVPLCR